MKPSWEDIAKRYGETLGDGPSDARKAQQMERFIASAAEHDYQRAQKDSRRRRHMKMLFGIALPATAMAVIAVVWVNPFSPTVKQLVCTTDSGLNVNVGDELKTSPSESKSLQFAEGSTVELSGGAEVTVAKLDRTNVQLRLRKGQLKARIKRRNKRRISWNYHAGPYLIHVVGTVLQIDWSPESHQLEVGVSRGKVSVTGPNIDAGGLTVAAGQRLAADARKGDVQLINPNAPSEPAIAPEVTKPQPPQKPAVSMAWRKLALAGRHEEAVQNAKAVGLSRLRTQLNAEDTLLLADTLRLSGDYKRSVQVLRRLRKRYPRTVSAKLAGLRLGRIAADHFGDSKKATYWLKQFIKEAPNHAKADRAMGRLIAALRASGMHDEAREVARQYVTKYPRGSYIDFAKTVLNP